MACWDLEREKQPVCTCLVYHIPFCNEAEAQHLFPPPLRAPGDLGSRAGWSCLGDLKEAPSPSSKVPDFGLMLVTVGVAVNLPSRVEWEEPVWVGDPTLAQKVLGVLPPGWVPPDYRAVPSVGLELTRAGGLSPNLGPSWWLSSHGQPFLSPQPSPAAPPQQMLTVFLTFTPPHLPQ